MGMFSSDVKSLDALFVDVLKQIYYAEREIGDQLEVMIGKAKSPELKSGFEQHLTETRNQYERLEQVFRMHGTDAEEVTCPAIDGILEAGNGMIGKIDDDQVMDAALTHAAQMVEHYEIVQYGTLSAWAKEMGRDDCASLLQKSLEEEKATDAKLTRIAESRLNAMAEGQRSPQPA
ncbi:MAG: ferritin-like domain-containing protein [Sphingomonas sp.]|nr:ferritin-like domain-containing protein [Sphingomonas sp.]